MGDQKKRIAIALIFLAILVVFMMYDYSRKRESQQQCVSSPVQNDQKMSPYILSITQPVTSFTGTIEKIEGNKITIQENKTFVKNSSKIPSPIVNTISYQVLISNKTRITQSSFSLYLFKITPTPPQQSSLSIKDLKIGQPISAEGTVDLRTLKGNEFEATSVDISPKINTFTGTITRIEGNALNIVGYVLNKQTGVFKKKELTGFMTEETEISHMTSGENGLVPKAIKYDYPDLKIDIQATIYTDKDITAADDATILRIDPIMNTPVPTP
jgi:hypothetical protein